MEFALKVIDTTTPIICWEINIIAIIFEKPVSIIEEFAAADNCFMIKRIKTRLMVRSGSIQIPLIIENVRMIESLGLIAITKIDTMHLVISVVVKIPFSRILGF